MIIKARITGNRRDVGTHSPKLLLIDIQATPQFTRSHCWVQISSSLASINIQGHHKPRDIIIDCDIIQYLKQGTIVQSTLKINKVIFIGKTRLPRKKPKPHTCRKKAGKIIRA